MVHIDIHSHFSGNHPDVIATLKELDLKMLNLAVPTGPAEVWRPPLAGYAELARSHPERYAWGTGMPVPDFTESDYAGAAMESIERDLDAGAVCVKVWKNTGMELRRPDGSFVQVDDPVFTPVFDWLERRGVTVIAHLAEPIICWRKETSGYYRENPEWYMYDKPDHPSHEEITAARDRLLERHPRLRFVGAHLASLEFDLGEIARRLDRFDCFAVGVGGRFSDLSSKGPAAVRDFFEAYRDRIMFGTDQSLWPPATELDEKTRGLLCERLRRDYGALYRFHETLEETEFWGEPLRGVGLPADVLDLYYEKNALRWFPGL